MQINLHFRYLTSRAGSKCDALVEDNSSITIICKAEPDCLIGIHSCARRRVKGSNPEPPPMLVETSVSMWIEKARLPCWTLYSGQLSHQRWIWQARKHTRDPPWLWNPGQMSPEVHNRGISETQGRCHQKSTTGVSVATRKGLVSSKTVLSRKPSVSSALVYIFPFDRQRIAIYINIQEWYISEDEHYFIRTIVWISTAALMGH